MACSSTNLSKHPLPSVELQESMAFTKREGDRVYLLAPSSVQHMSEDLYDDVTCAKGCCASPNALDEFGESRGVALELAPNAHTNLALTRHDAIFRKVSRALLPIFFLLTFLNLLDRSNLGFVSIPLLRDLGLSPSQYGFGSGLFALGYSLCQVPSQMTLEKVGAPLWLAAIVTLWGVVASSMAGINGVTYFYVVRLLLGMVEAGSFPGVWFYLSRFYSDNNITLPIAIMESAIMLAQVVGAPLAVVLLRLDGIAGVKGWQWLFIIEGGATALLGMSLFWLLPASPKHAKWLSASEAAVVQAEVDACRKCPGAVPSRWAMLRSAFSNLPLWHITLVKFLKGCTTAGTMLWVALIIEALLHERGTGGSACDTWKHDRPKGKGELVSGGDYLAILLTGVPYALAAASCVAVARHSQVTKERIRHIAVPYIATGSILVLLPSMTQLHPLLGFLGLTASIALSFSANGPLMSLVTAIATQDGHGMATSLGVCNSISDLSGSFGPILLGVVLEQTCSYNISYFVLGAMMLSAGALVLLLKDPSAKHQGLATAGLKADSENRPLHDGRFVQ